MWLTPSLCATQVEVCSPRISHLLSFCCDAFTKEQLCNLECLILLRLNFRLAAPTLAFFLDYYTNNIEAAQLVSENTGGDSFARMNPDKKRLRQCSNLARKVCELSLADYAFNKYPPSLTASCALRLASELLKTEPGLVEQATIQSLDELSTQPYEGPEISEGDSLAVKAHFLSVSQGSYNLAQECKDNLKLLVSLNQETMEVMSAMWLHVCHHSDVSKIPNSPPRWGLHSWGYFKLMFRSKVRCLCRSNLMYTSKTICWLQPLNVLQRSIVVLYLFIVDYCLSSKYINIFCLFQFILNQSYYLLYMHWLAAGLRVMLLLRPLKWRTRENVL